MAAILKEDPPALAEEEVSPPIAEVVGRCLEKDPEARFQSAHDLALALEVLATSVAETRPAVPVIAPARTPVHWGRRLLILGGVLVVVAGVVLALRHLMTPAGPPRVTNPRLVHSTRTPLHGAATDGRWFYYSSSDYRLVQLSVAGGETTEICPWPERRMFIAVASLSPVDPTQLLVTASEAPRGANMFMPIPLWVLSLPSGAPRRVGEISTNSAVWSPDGETIAYSDAQGPAIFVVGKDGASPRKVADVEGFPWVLDWSDEHILYGCFDFARNRFQPWEVGTDGSEPRRLLDGWPDPWVWKVLRTPGGRHLLLVSGGQMGGRLWALEEGSAEPVPMTREPLAFFDLDLAPGRPVAYTLSVRSRMEPFVYRPEIEDWAPSDSWLDPSGHRPAWSADGEWVAWSSGIDGTLWRARADGTQRLRLTEPREHLHAGFISWSPDAERLLFTTGSVEGLPKEAAFVVSRGGVGLKRLSEEGVIPNRPAWSPDERVVLSFAHEAEAGPGRVPLRLVDPETGEWEEMPGTSELYGTASSPTGQLLAAHDRTERPGIHLFDWESGQWRRLDGAVGGLLEWSADGSFLYFVQSFDNWRVRRYRLADGHIETVAEEGTLDPANPLRGYSVDPEGRVVVMRSQNRGEIHAWDLVLP
jgi:WD40 repeat protein